MSRIYYDGKFYDYPLRASNALRNLGVVEAVPCVALVHRGRASGRRRTSDSFEGWVSARFGWRLYRIFFKTYTEKVWGVPADRAAGRLGRPAHQEPLAAEGRRQRAAAQAERRSDVTSLIEEFQYPSTGPG